MDSHALGVLFAVAAGLAFACAVALACFVGYLVRAYRRLHIDTMQAQRALLAAYRSESNLAIRGLMSLARCGVALRHLGVPEEKVRELLKPQATEMETDELEPVRPKPKGPGRDGA